MNASVHVVSVYVLLKSDKIQLLKTKLDVLYVVNIHPVYSIEDVSQGGFNMMYLIYS